MHTTKLPETDEEIEKFIRQCESGEIPEPPPFSSSKLLARMCVMQTRIDELEAECARLHSHWHAAEQRANVSAQKDMADGHIIENSGLTIAKWLSEREANAREIASQKSGDDARGWLEDAAFYRCARKIIAQNAASEGRRSEA